jgi:hypothetical protein
VDTPLTSAEYLALVINELGLAETSAPVRHISLLWRKHAPSGAVSTFLRYLYTKRDAIRFLLSDAATKHDIKAGDVAEAWSQDFTHLRMLLEDTNTQITAELATVSGGRGASVGQLTQVAPIQVEDGTYPNPNERAYRGDPLRRTF